MKTRNEIYGGTFSSPEAPDTNVNGELKKLVLSDSADITKNRTSWIRTILYNILDSFTHKTEDRATSSDLGVRGAEPTSTKYVTVEQLPSVDKTTNDFTGSAGSGALTDAQNTIDITTVLTGTNKSFVGKLHADFVAWLLARTRTEAETVTLVNNTIYGEGTTSGLIPVGTIWDYCGLDDPNGFINLCLTGSVRSISKASGAGTLKNDNYQNLFIKLYLSYADLRCPVSGGRSGADATAALNDFVSGKAISLPDYRGRVGGYYKLGDDNFGEVGKPIGTDLIEAAHLPLNSPWNIVDTHQHTYFDNAGSGQHTDPGNGDGGKVNTTNDIGRNTTGTTGSIILNTNVSTDRKHFQPTIIQTAIIKY